MTAIAAVVSSAYAVDRGLRALRVPVGGWVGGEAPACTSHARNNNATQQRLAAPWA